MKHRRKTMRPQTGDRDWAEGLDPENDGIEEAVPVVK
jgi:hypothetical protein